MLASYYLTVRVRLVVLLHALNAKPTCDFIAAYTFALQFSNLSQVG